MTFLIYLLSFLILISVIVFVHELGHYLFARLFGVRILDFSIVQNSENINMDVVEESLRQMRIDSEGLDEMDRKYLKCISSDYNGGPVGIETLSAALLEQRDIIEDVIEPYLMQKGLVQRTSRGRILSDKGMKHIT